MAYDPSAQFWCDACQLLVTGDRIEAVRAGSGSLATCATCKRALIPQNEAAKPTFGRLTRERAPEGMSFPRILAGALLYPFRTDSLIIVGGIAFFVWFVGLAAGLGDLLGLAVQLGLLFQLVRATAEGHEEWNVIPEGSRFSEWMAPLIKYSLVMFIAALPAIIVGFATHLAPLAALAGLFGLVYLPAGFIAASFPGGWLGPLNPLPAISLIARIPVQYAVTLGFLVLALVIGGTLAFLGQALVATVAMPMIPGVIAAFLRFLGPVVMARMLGLLVREHADELFGA
ncbi:Hypothetical protein A7982_10600 [Minicystis rosea]|nr:Hypothetical protein A7982_10600 [Minicystis rosea]